MPAAPVTWVSSPVGARRREVVPQGADDDVAGPAGEDGVQVDVGHLELAVVAPERRRELRARVGRVDGRDGVAQARGASSLGDPGRRLGDVRAVGVGEAAVAREGERRRAGRGGARERRLERVVRLHRGGVRRQERRLVGHPLGGQRRREEHGPRCRSDPRQGDRVPEAVRQGSQSLEHHPPACAGRRPGWWRGSAVVAGLRRHATVRENTRVYRMRPCIEYRSVS